MSELSGGMKGKGADELGKTAIFKASDVNKLKPVWDQVKTKP